MIPKFACQQTDLIELFTTEKLKDPVKAEKLRYQILAATASARYDRFINRHQPVPDLKTGQVAYENVISVDAITRARYSSNYSLHTELEREGRRAAAKGKTFSGCGSTAKAEGEDDNSTSEDQLNASGYGNKSYDPEIDSAPKDKYGSRKFRCRKGHINKRDKNKLIEKCKTCGTSVKC